MKILGISGGTKNGNNDAICKEALMGAKECGAEIEFIRLLDLELRHCTGCGFCMRSLNLGQGGGCAQKDDFAWLRDRVLDADGILFSIPVFEKGAADVFHTLLNRFGPGNDIGTNLLSRQTTRDNGGTEPDPRLFKKKAVAFLGTGGTDYTTRFQCECSMLASLMMWNVIACEIYQWTKCFVMEDDRVHKAHLIGAGLARAAQDPAGAQSLSPQGVCPHCGCSNFYLYADGRAECCLCGIKGMLKSGNGTLQFVFDADQLDLASDTLKGKLRHAVEIRDNQAKRMEIKRTNEFKRRQERYEEFIHPSMPVTYSAADASRAENIFSD